MYTLIGTPKARPFRVVWALEEIGLEYDLIEAAPGSKEVVAANPSGKVPAFKDGDDLIIDSVAIIQYLADKHGKLTFPAGTIERAQQDSFMQFILDDFDACLWTFARHKFALPAEYRIAEIRRTQEYLFAEALNILDQRMGDGPYLMGSEFTVPDIVLMHCFGWARSAKFDMPSEGKISVYIKRCITRPAYQKAHALRLS